MLINLSEVEAKEMRNILMPFSTDSSCIEQLDRICAKDVNERSPFIMSMYAFDKNFKGVKPYILSFLKSLRVESKKVLAYIALADYANEHIDLNFFLIYLKLKKSKIFCLNRTELLIVLFH